MNQFDLTPVQRLIYNYPQLTLYPMPQLNETIEYKNIVRKGILPDDNLFNCNTLNGTDSDDYYLVDTPAGNVEIYYLSDRKDFEHVIQILAYKGNPTPLPTSMGAITLSGLTNWRKIHVHKESYINNGGEDWKQEFKSFTAYKENYQDTIIILSKGSYSGVDMYHDIVRNAVISSSASIDITNESYSDKWLSISKTIRHYHELTHFICRKLYPQNKEAIRDEIIADCIGIVAALGYYNSDLAKLFLGIESNDYRSSGRLINYLSEDDNLEVIIGKASKIISLLKQISTSDLIPFELLHRIESQRIGLDI